MTLLYLSSLSALPLTFTLPLTVPYEALPTKAAIKEVLPAAQPDADELALNTMSPGQVVFFSGAIDHVMVHCRWQPPALLDRHKILDYTTAVYAALCKNPTVCSTDNTSLHQLLQCPGAALEHSGCMALDTEVVLLTRQENPCKIVAYLAIIQSHPTSQHKAKHSTSKGCLQAQQQSTKLCKLVYPWESVSEVQSFKETQQTAANTAQKERKLHLLQKGP